VGGIGRSTHVVGLVLATECAQHLRHHRLHADRQAGDAAGGVGPGPLQVEVVGVALHGHLGAGGEGNRGEDLQQLVGRYQARGPATHEHAGHRREAGRRLLDLAAARREVALGEVGAVGPGGEGAVVAAVPAEGHVHVDPERHLRSVPSVRAAPHPVRRPPARTQRVGNQTPSSRIVAFSLYVV
jgi:hypothetical protein